LATLSDVLTALKKISDPAASVHISSASEPMQYFAKSVKTDALSPMQKNYKQEQIPD
jgi:hypothetical protein